MWGAVCNRFLKDSYKRIKQILQQLHYTRFFTRKRELFKQKSRTAEDFPVVLLLFCGLCQFHFLLILTSGFCFLSRGVGRKLTIHFLKSYQSFPALVSPYNVGSDPGEKFQRRRRDFRCFYKSDELSICEMILQHLIHLTIIFQYFKVEIFSKKVLIFRDLHL